MFEPRPQQPQSVGDLVGRAFRIYRGHIPLFVHILLWPTVFCTAGKVALQWGVAYALRSSNFRDLNTIAVAGAAVVVGLIVSLIGIWVLTLRQLAFVRMANGFAGSFQDAYQYISKRTWTIIGLMILGYVLLVAAIVVWIVEFYFSILLIKQGHPASYGGLAAAGLGIVGLLTFVVFFLLVGFLVFTIAACEEQGVSTLISRGFSLTVRDFGRSLLFGLLLLLTISALSYPLSLPLVLLSVFEFFRHNMSTDTLTDPAKMPLYCLVATQVWESLVNMLLWPITFIAYGLFYYDLRMRQEGLDVLQDLKNLNLTRQHST